MLETIKPAEAKKALTALLHKAAYSHRPIIFESRGKPIAAVISMEMLELLRKALEEMEDLDDWLEMQAALKDPENGPAIPWKDVEDALDLQDRREAKSRKGTSRPRSTNTKRRAHGH